MLQQSMFAHEIVSVKEAGAGGKKGDMYDLEDNINCDAEAKQSNNNELTRPIKQGLPIGQLTVLDSDDMKYTVTVTRVGRSSVEHGVNGHPDSLTSSSNYRLHCVHMFGVFNVYQLRSATCI